MGDHWGGSGQVGCPKGRGPCQGGVDGQVWVDPPPASSFARVYINLTLAEYSQALFQRVQPALLAALGQATKGGAASLAATPVGSAKPLTAATSFDVRGRGAVRAAAALADGLRRDLKGWQGLAPFRVGVPGMVRVEVTQPAPAWLPKLERRVINATLAIELGGLGKKALTPARRDVLVAGLKAASGGTWAGAPAHALAGAFAHVLLPPLPLPLPAAAAAAAGARWVGRGIAPASKPRHFPETQATRRAVRPTWRRPRRRGRWRQGSSSGASMRTSRPTGWRAG